MNLRDNAAVSLITLSSMGVRLTPAVRQPVHLSDLYTMRATSAESNVLSVSAALGLRAKVLTKFVKSSPIAQFIKSELRRRNIEFEGPDVDQGGPWGYRHQFNIADSGFGARGPRVHNDRAGEVGRTLSAADFDLKRVFGAEGCQILHLSGLIAAMSPETAQCCLAVAHAAKDGGALVSFDLNFRASFWKGREAELRAVFAEIAGLSDILIGNEEDFQLALNIEGPEAGGRGLAAKIDSFKDMIARVQKAYPNAKVFATTLREVISANSHNWGALLLADGQWYVEQPREIPILDRIGGGDGFVSGLLYGILKGWEPQKWLQFGWATGALATTVIEDFATPADEDQVWDIHKGNARVKR
ncbi:MAG: sugar kinase [Oscillospiraceae bacterium]|jgi:2-dehydro-3-deoxygluconokinase|nr:sugar kinase [Oscillospiraceae bacterium]